MVEISKRRLLQVGAGFFLSGMTATKLLEQAFIKAGEVEFTSEELSTIDEFVNGKKSLYYFNSILYQEIKDLDNNQKKYKDNPNPELLEKINKNKRLIRVYSEVVKKRTEKNVKNNF